jgi:opacity protein-like surface antigen
MKPLQIIFLLLSASAMQKINAQDSSLLKMLNDSMALNEKSFFVTGTFKANHVVNMQTIEGPGAGALNLEIQHRFGKVNSGIYDFFGLDNAGWRLGFDYGITKRLVVGVGRSSFEKTYDGYIKYKLLRQTDGNNKMPFTLSVLGTISNYTLDQPDKPYLNAMYRTAYTTQLLIARKFSSRFSLQIVPTYLHYNLVPTTADKNDVFALSGGARMKISKRMSINAEYNYLPSGQVVSSKVYDSFSLGWDIETGGHVFQLVFSNSQSMIESQYLTQTNGQWSNGDIYFGFNVSRNFNLSKHAKQVATPAKH